MLSTMLLRTLADEREREIRDLVRTRALLSRRERVSVATPRKETRARGR